MDEFIKLILTGDRLRRLKRLNTLFLVTAVAEMLSALPILFIATPSAHAAVSIALGVLVIVFGVLNTVLSYLRAGLCKTLVSEQIFADGLNDDGESAARKALAEKYAELYTGKYAKLIAVMNLIPVGIYLAADVISALVNMEITSSSFIVPILFFLATVMTIAIAFISALKDSKHRTELYESANEEIAFLKRCAGLGEYEIAKQSYNARETATRSQELFLCDPADRTELRRIASAMGYTSLALAALFIAATVVLGLVSENSDNLFMTVCSSCVIALLFGVFIAVAVWTEIRRRAVYRRNAAKLTDSEADSMRKYLQNEFMKLQRTGNIFFSLFCGIPALTGFILGVIGAVKDPEVSFIENVLGLTMVFFLLSAVLASVIWTVIYCVYRRKVKPVEMQLSETVNKL